MSWSAFGTTGRKVFAPFVVLLFVLGGFSAPTSAQSLLDDGQPHVDAVLDSIRQTLNQTGLDDDVEAAMDLLPVTACTPPPGTAVCVTDPMGPEHETCAGDHGAQPYVPGTTPSLLVEGTLTFNRALASHAWSEDCPAPPSTAEMHTYAEACPTLPSGSSSVTPSVEGGVYCGPIIPPFGSAVCRLTPTASNLISPGLSIGLDRPYMDVVVGDLKTKVAKDMDGIIKWEEGEILQDAKKVGTAVSEYGVYIDNPHGEWVRLIAYPTSLHGPTVASMDSNEVGCQASSFTSICFSPFSSPVPSKCMGSTGSNGTGITPFIPSPTDYEPERRPTPFSGGTPKEICFCGGGEGAGADGTVNVVNGEFVTRFTPLAIAAARGEDWEFNMTYRTLSPDATNEDERLGFHWDYGYGKNFESLPSDHLKFHDGDGLSRIYEPVSTTGTITKYSTPEGYHDEVQYDSASGNITRTDREGTVETYEDNRLSKITDRNGNTIAFERDASGKLLSSVDAHNRLINFEYDGTGRIEAIHDFAGRSIGFIYCGEVLCRIAGLGGTNVTFTYYSNGAMASIIDAENETYLHNAYDTQNRVRLQRYGEPEQIFYFHYRPTELVTTVFDRSANRVDHHYEPDAPMPTKKVVFSNRGVDPADEPTYTTLYERNRHYELTRVIHPRGNQDIYVFDEDSMARRSQGNLLNHTVDPVASCEGLETTLLVDLLVQAGLIELPQQPRDCEPRSTTYTYDGDYNQLLSMTDARGHSSNYTAPNGGPVTPARYTTTYQLDGNGNRIGVHRPIAHAFGAPPGLEPTVGAQAAIDTYVYNSHGQVIEHVDAQGVKESFEYFPAKGPLYNATDREGFLANQTRDIGGLDLRTNFTYSILGEVTNITDPAGNEISIQYDDRCLINDFEGPDLLDGPHELMPQAWPFGADNETADGAGSPLANRTRLAWAIAENETHRLSLEDNWTELPDYIDWFLLDKDEQEAYASELRIWTNSTGELFHNGTHGLYVKWNNTFVLFGNTSLTDFLGGSKEFLFNKTNWLLEGELIEMGLNESQRGFLERETKRFLATADLIGGPLAEDKPLQHRNLTRAGQWAHGRTGTASSFERDLNGQAVKAIRSGETQDASGDHARRVTGASVDETQYNVLGLVTAEVLHTAALLPENDNNETTVTEYFYDYNDNLVCKHYPMRVQEGRMYNVESWIYNERDLMHMHARGDSLTPVNTDGRATCADPYCAPDDRLFDAPAIPEPQNPQDLPPLDPCCPSVGSWNGDGAFFNATWTPCPPPYAEATREFWNYDGNGNPVRHIDARDNSDFKLYNGFDESIVELDEHGIRHESYRDPAGRVTEEKWFRPEDAMMPLVTELLEDLESLVYLGLGDYVVPQNETLLQWHRTMHDERGRAYETQRGILNESTDSLLFEEPVRFVSRFTQQDSLDRVMRSVDATGAETRSEYDAAGRLVERVDPAGNTVTKRYDNASNVIEEVRFKLDLSGIHGSYQIVTERDHDAAGRVVNETDSQGRNETYAYDTYGNRVATEDATGKVHKQVYDGAGNPVVEYYRLGTKNLTIASISANFTVPGWIHALNGTIETDGNMTVNFTECNEEECLPPEACMPYTNATCEDRFMEPCSYLSETNASLPHGDGCCVYLDPDNVNGTRCMEFDASYNHTANATVVNGTLDLGNDLAFEGCYSYIWPNFACVYNGSMAEMLLPTFCDDQIPTTCSPSQEMVGSCLNEFICPDANTTVPNGTVVLVHHGPYWDQHVDENGTWDGRSYYYGLTMYQEWDRNGRLISRIDGEGNPTNYTYDDLNRQRSEIYADGSTILFSYDGNDNKIRVQDPNGNDVMNVYDALDRLVEVNVTRGSGVVGTDHQAFTYDGLGRMTSSLDEVVGVPASTVSREWAYDSFGYVVSESTNGHAVLGSYDEEGRRIGMEYPNGRVVNRTYDTAGRLIEIADVHPDPDDFQGTVEETLAAYGYVGWSLASRTYGNGVERTVSYINATHNYTMPLSITDRDADGDLLVGLNYTYDEALNKRSTQRLHAPDQSVAYALDVLHRMVGYERGTLGSSGMIPASSGLQSQSWNLTHGNDWANTTVTKDGSSVDEARLHNERHELLQATGATTTLYTYDPNGNLLSDGLYTYHWDFKNRLVRIDNATTGDMLRQYHYDAGNRRTLEDREGNITLFVLDGKQEIEERNATGELLRQYVFGPSIDEVVLLDVFEPVEGPFAGESALLQEALVQAQQEADELLAFIMSQVPSEGQDLLNETQDQVSDAYNGTEEQLSDLVEQAGGIGGALLEQGPMVQVPDAEDLWVLPSEVAFRFCSGSPDHEGVVWKVMAPNGALFTFTRQAGAASHDAHWFSLDGTDLMGLPTVWDYASTWSAAAEVPANGTWAVWMERPSGSTYACAETDTPVMLDVAPADPSGSALCFRHGGAGLNNPMTWNQHHTQGTYNADMFDSCSPQTEPSPEQVLLDAQRSPVAYKFFVDPLGGAWDPVGFAEFIAAAALERYLWMVPDAVQVPSSASSCLFLGDFHVCDPEGPWVQSHHLARFYYLLDDQRSTVALTNGTGVLVEGYDYSPYGAPVAYAPGPNGVVEWGGDDEVFLNGTGPIGNRVLYTGRSWDGETGLHYYRTRYVSSEMGRFISSDSIGVWGDAAGLGNGYQYCGNQAPGCLDSNGEFACISMWCNWTPQSIDRSTKMLDRAVDSGGQLFEDIGNWIKEGHRYELSVCAFICVSPELGVSSRGPSFGLGFGVGLGVQGEHTKGNTKAISCSGLAQASDWSSTHPEEASIEGSIDAQNEYLVGAEAEAGRNPDTDTYGTGGFKAEVECQVSPLDPLIDLGEAIFG